MRVKDYILRDLDIRKLADIFEHWSCLLKDMNFLLKNQRYIDQFFDIYSNTNAIELANMRGNVHRTENQEAVAQRYAEIDRESDVILPNLDSSQNMQNLESQPDALVDNKSERMQVYNTTEQNMSLQSPRAKNPKDANFNDAASQSLR